MSLRDVPRPVLQATYLLYWEHTLHHVLELVRKSLLVRCDLIFGSYKVHKHEHKSCLPAFQRVLNPVLYTDIYVHVARCIRCCGIHL